MYRNLLLLFVCAISAIKCLPTNKTIEIMHMRSLRSASIKKQLPALDLQKDVLNVTQNLHQPVKTLTASEKAIESAPKDVGNNHQHVLHMNDVSIEDYKPGFYAFAGLSAAALLFFLFKSYRLRSSRAERKYGVQGDRTTQELTPLPVALEDANSDDDDQTIFELNRQHIVL